MVQRIRKKKGFPMIGGSTSWKDPEKRHQDMASKIDKIIPDFAIFVKSFLEPITTWNQATFLIPLRYQKLIFGGNKQKIGGSTKN
jgi:hypothetical protein